MSAIKKIFWFSLLVKLILAAALPLTNDESYYWVWSKNMQLSYYDHPPFVAWLYWLGHGVSWFPGSVRWPGVLFAQATLGIWLRLLKPFLNSEQRRYWLLLALLSPLVGGSGIVLTPDLPLMFFYSLSLWLYFRWLEKPDVPLSMAFGVAMGLGFSSKYMMVLFGLSLLPMLYWSPLVRRAFVKSWWILLGGLALGALPVWLWNFMHDFASLKFQAAHGLGNPAWKPHWTFEYLGVQIAFIFPVVLYWAIQARRQMPRVFHFLAWVPLGFFLLTTYRGYVEANWPIVAYPPIYALAASSIPRNARSLKFTFWLWGLLLSGAAAVILLQPNWARNLKFKEFHQFDHAIEAARSLDPLYARSYQMAAKMHFELARPVYKIKGLNRVDFYDFLPESSPTAPTIYVVVEKEDRLPPEMAVYHRVEILPVDETYEIWKMERSP